MRDRTALGRAIETLVLVNFAVAQPLYDLLGRDAAFFTVRRSEPVDVVLLVVLLTAGLPAGLVALERLVGAASAPAAGRFHSVVVGVLGTLLAGQALARVDGLSALAALVVAALLGAGLVFALERAAPLRQMLTVLAPAPLLFAGLFLFASPVRGVVFGREDPRTAFPAVASDTPVVMVVFDEFNGAWLMDADGRIDAARYPNLAALAARSTWFRNATTVSDDTVYAVPALLTGRRPAPGARALPSAANYPQNLFTLLGGSYDLQVSETVVKLCPETLCPETAPAPLAERMRTLALDLAIVYLHLALVPDLAAGLPVVSQSWQGFTESGEDLTRPSREATLTRWIAGIEATRRPSLHFLHVLLPHTPWRYLPSGRAYEGLGDASYLEGWRPVEARWVDDEWPVTQAFQRYLLQVAMVDRRIGALVSRLEAQGLYDRALVVVTADHGVSFEPGESRRAVSDRNVADIASVPLIVKAPFQREGVVSDRNVETIDILPTIADLLDVEIPWAVDGQSALDASAPDRPVKTLIATGDGRVLRLAPTGPIRRPGLARMRAVFGSGTRAGLFRIGRYRDLVGRAVAEVAKGPAAEVTAALEWPALYENVDPEGPLVPARIRGRVRVAGARPAPVDLAVAVNGTIEAVTRAWDVRVGEGDFSAMVPEQALRKGANRVEVLVVTGPPERPVVRPTRDAARTTYALVPAPDGALRIVASDDRSIPVVPGALAGAADGTRQRTDGVALVGWAADLERGRPAETILVFVDGEFHFATTTGSPWPSVAQKFGKPALVHSGFHLHLPAALFPDLRHADVRVFAVSAEGIASEVPTIGTSPRRSAPR